MILNENGEIIAVYETVPKGDISQTRASWSINWTVKPGVQTAGNSRIQSYDGLTFDLNIDFSRTGSSKIGIAAHDEETVYWTETSSDGFYGRLTVNENVGMVSLAIRNDSKNTITYSGTYTI